MTPLEVMREQGFGKGDGPTPPDAGVCILTAMFRAGLLLFDPTRDEYKTAFAYREQVRRVIREQFPDRPGAVHRFNDHPDTTADDVEMVLEKTELILAEKGLL